VENMCKQDTCFRNCRHAPMSHDLVEKDRMCVEAGRRVPEKWFYTDRHAKERSMTMNARDFEMRRT